jgi:glycosyltransferase involved in cell wall biosynthesis
LAPNKAVEDVVAALFVHRMRHDPAARLVVIGKPAIRSYVAALHEHVARLGLLDAVQFLGHVDDAQLSRAYRQADVLMVASEHEGFCLPVVEAMAHGLPVVAYREGALPEVLGDAGVLVTDKDPSALANAAHRLTTDASTRAAVIAAGRARLPHLGLADAGDRLVELVMAVRAGRTLPTDA